MFHIDGWRVVLPCPHGLRCIEVKFHSHSLESMASETPKKLYRKENLTGSISRCRLCNCVADPKHSKSLFRKQNHEIVRNAEIFYGADLPEKDELPRRICGPCERRLNNAIQFRKVIAETQRKLHADLRAKRCVELSPSVNPPTKVQAARISRHQRSIHFNAAATDSHTQNVKSVSIYLLLFPLIIFSFCLFV